MNTIVQEAHPRIRQAQLSPEMCSRVVRDSMSSDSVPSSEVAPGGAAQSLFAPPKIVAGPETVINPEGRPAPTVRSDSSVTPNSSIVRVLFPSSDLSADSDASAGLTLAHFKIVSRIRTGGMGAVYRATDLR